MSKTFIKSSKKFRFSSFLCPTGYTYTPKLNLLNVLPKMFYFVKIYKKSNVLFQFVGKTISVNFLVHNCPGAKLSDAKLSGAIGSG